jgi:preprotein translocase subunit SecA
VYNILECINADEFNYYLLNTIDSLDLDSTNTKVMISGDVTSGNDEYYQRIIKYFKTPEFADSRLIVNQPELFKNVSPHTYFSLISLDECE